MKSKEFGRPGGGVRPSRPPLDPPMLHIFLGYARNKTITNYDTIPQEFTAPLTSIKGYLTVTENIYDFLDSKNFIVRNCSTFK